MKKLILIPLLLFALIGSSHNNVINHSEYNVTEFVESCLKELNIDSVIITIVTMSKPIKGKYEGYTMKMQDHGYAIYAVSTMLLSDFKRLLAHELVHVWQYETSLSVIGKTATFKQVNYEARDSEHYNRPYEIEAREKGKELYDKFKMKF
jgi:hypothetical protein